MVTGKRAYGQNSSRSSEGRTWCLRVGAHRVRRRVWRSTRLLRRSRLAQQSAAANRIEARSLTRSGARSPGAVVTILDGPLAGTTKVYRRVREIRVREATRRAGRPFASAGTVSAPDASAVAVAHPRCRRRGAVHALVAGAGDRSRTRGYTLAVTVDLATAGDRKERPNTPCAGFPVELASRSYRAEIKETPGRDLHPLRDRGDSHTPLARPVRVLRLGKLRRVRHGGGRRRNLRGLPWIPLSRNWRAHQASGARDAQWVVGLDPLPGAISYCA